MSFPIAVPIPSPSLILTHLPFSWPAGYLPCPCVLVEVSLLVARKSRDSKKKKKVTEAFYV